MKSKLKPRLKHTKYFIFTVFIILFCHSGCKTKETSAEAPDLKKTSIVKRPLSTITIPISMEIAQLEKSLNQQFNGVLYDDNSFENNDQDELMIKITKLGDFKISVNGDVVKIIAPIDIYVVGRLKKDLFSVFDQNIGINQTKDARFKINLQISSKISVQPNWDLTTKTQLEYKWLEKPYLELGFVKIPIQSVVENILNSKIKQINSSIDKEISSQIKLKAIADSYWKSIQTPILISEAYSSYLCIAPESVSISSIQSNSKNIFINIGILTDLSVQTKSDLKIKKPSTLPDLQIKQASDSIFHLYFGAQISYAEASRIAKEYFNGKEFQFEEGKQKVTINDIEIKHNGNKLMLELDLQGNVKKGLIKKKFKGKVYALGTPYYDSKDQSIKIKDFDFDIKSKDVLIGTAEWVFKSNFRKQIESQLKYPLSSDINQSMKASQNALNNIKIKNLSLSSKIEKIEPYGIIITDEGIEMIIQTEGLLKVKIDAL